MLADHSVFIAVAGTDGDQGAPVLSGEKATGYDNA